MRRLALLLALSLAIPGCEQAGREVALYAFDAAPARLSEWGLLFADGERLELNTRVLPYELNTPLFSDYALKLRGIWLPEGTTARYRNSGVFDFPVGTIISKTFHYERAPGWTPTESKVLLADRNTALDQSGTLPLSDYLLIETRLLVRYGDGWKALPYVWNAAQDEAYLAPAGDLLQLELIGADRRHDITYVVPDVNQCAGCHTPDHGSKELQPLGPRAWQLNRPYKYPTASANQLEHWVNLGYLEGTDDPIPKGTSWTEPGDAPLEARAKAYLDANCAHCHNANGAADTSALHLNVDAPVDRFYGICKTPVAVGRGSGNRPYDIYPGRPDDSILLYRMEHSDPAIAMPELGRSAIHVEAVALIREWIAALNGEC